MKDNMLHYVACGLANIWLENGYEVSEGPDGNKTFSIHNLEELHDVIGLTLLEKDSTLDGDEIRFLRTELGMSRKALGAALGYSPETIKKWESGENAIQKSADILLRSLYREYNDENSAVKELVDKVNEIQNKARSIDLKFKEQAGLWMRDDDCA